MPEFNISRLYVRQDCSTTSCLPTPNTNQLARVNGTGAPTTNELINIVSVTGIAFGSVLVAVALGMLAGMVCCGMIYKYKMKRFVAERDQQETHRRRLYERQVHAIEAPEAAEPVKRHHGKKHIAFTQRLEEIDEVDEPHNDSSPITNSHL